MAYQIKKLFDDDDLAERLSQNAYKIAQVRHNPEKTAAQYLDIYNNVINDFKK